MELSYQQWLEKFRPTKNHIDNNASFDGLMFETFGDELQFVLDQVLTFKVWTLLEGDEGTWIVNGYHVVNRLGYFVTENAFGPLDHYEVNLDD